MGSFFRYNLQVRVVIFLFSLFFVFCGQAMAIVDPIATPNNKLGIHILFPDEVSKAANIVNDSQNGQWGYVVIPIQNIDRDRKKWQHFFDTCKDKKVIPIIRVATTANGPHWELPSQFDLIDFANFLNDLDWPTKNRYVIILNEVNRNDEFGGKANPEQYADFLNLAIDVFKGKSEDFFILPAGLDNAANDPKNSIKWTTFLDRMHSHRSDIFSRIDGWNSHAYPNPDFSARADLKGENKISSFETDLNRLQKYTAKNLPVFITETGWSAKYLSEKQIGLYYQYALEKVWNHPQIVTVAPFLLDAKDGPFVPFSFLDKEGKEKEFVPYFSKYSSIGNPILPEPKKIPTPTSTNSSELAVATTSSEVLAIEVDAGQKQSFFQKIYNYLKSKIEDYVYNSR